MNAKCRRLLAQSAFGKELESPLGGASEERADRQICPACTAWQSPLRHSCHCHHCTTGFIISHPRAAKFGGCSPPRMMWECMGNVPPPFCESKGKHTENDGNDTSCCSDKGLVCAHCEKLQVVRAKQASMFPSKVPLRGGSKASAALLPVVKISSLFVRIAWRRFAQQCFQRVPTTLSATNRSTVIRDVIVMRLRLRKGLGLCSHRAHMWATSDFLPVLSTWDPPRLQGLSSHFSQIFFRGLRLDNGVGVLH